MRQVRFSNLQKHKSERKIASTFGSWKGILLQRLGKLSALGSPRDVKLKVRLIQKIVLTFQRVTCLDSETMEYGDIHLVLSHGRLWAQLRRRSPFYRKFFLHDKVPLSFYLKISVCLSVCRRETVRLYKKIGARGGVVVKALRYKPAGRGFDSRWCHWNFSVT